VGSLPDAKELTGMASKVSSRQQALAKARERRSALDQDRAARDRRVEEATAQVLLQLQERAAAEQAVQVANAQIGAALRRLLQDEGIAAEGVAGLVDLTVSEVRRLARAVLPAGGSTATPPPVMWRARRGSAVTWRRCRPQRARRGSPRPSGRSGSNAAKGRDARRVPAPDDRGGTGGLGRRGSTAAVRVGTGTTPSTRRPGYERSGAVERRLRPEEPADGDVVSKPRSRPVLPP